MAGSRKVQVFKSGGATLSVSEELLPLFRANERKKFYRDAVSATITRWFNEYGPLRFTRYTMAKIPAYTYKGGKDGIPFHESGETKIRFGLFSRVQVSGTSRGAHGKLVGNLPKYLNYKDLFRMFATIPDNERESLARWYEQAMIDQLTGASSKVPQRASFLAADGSMQTRRGRRSRKIHIAGG